jgi:hypothetical protein
MGDRSSQGLSYTGKRKHGSKNGAHTCTFLLRFKFEPTSRLFEQPKAVRASFPTARATCMSELPFLSLSYSFSTLLVTKYSSFDKESIHISDYDRVLFLR